MFGLLLVSGANLHVKVHQVWTLHKSAQIFFDHQVHPLTVAIPKHKSLSDRALMLSGVKDYRSWFPIKEANTPFMHNHHWTITLLPVLLLNANTEVLLSSLNNTSIFVAHPICEVKQKGI